MVTGTQLILRSRLLHIIPIILVFPLFTKICPAGLSCIKMKTSRVIMSFSPARAVMHSYLRVEENVRVKVKNKKICDWSSTPYTSFWREKTFALIKLNKFYERQEFDLKFLSNAAVERYTWVCGRSRRGLKPRFFHKFSYFCAYIVFGVPGICSIDIAHRSILQM